MSAFRIEKQSDSLVRISGELDLTNAAAVKKQTMGLFNGASELQFDLSAVGQSNSAALALMLEWMKLAEKHRVSLSFNHFPEHLRELARVYGIEQDLTII